MTLADVRDMAFAFSEAICPAGRPMPLVPMFEKRGYLEEWSAWQDRPQTAEERESIRAGRRVTTSKSGKTRPGDRQRPAKLWGGVMQNVPAVVVVDLDDVVKMRALWPDTLRRYAVDVRTPVRVQTGRDPAGAHLYYRVEGDAPRLKTDLGGWDMKGAGGLVVLPGGLHETGRRYVLKVDAVAVDPRRFSPGELYARLPAFPLADHLADLERVNISDGVAHTGPRKRYGSEHARFDPDTEGSRRRVRRYLDRAGAAVEGEGGHRKTLSLISRFADWGVDELVTREEVRAWNLHNLPPWSDHDLDRLLRDGYWGSHRDGPVGGDLLVDE